MALIRAFNEVKSFDFTEQLTQQIRNEIQSKGKEYIIGVNEDEFKKYLIDKYSLEPLSIDSKHLPIKEPSISKEWRENHWREKYQVEVYTFTVTFQYSGSSIMFKVQPSTWIMRSESINVDEQNFQVSFSFKLDKKDPNEFNRVKNDYYSAAFGNLDNANGTVHNWNNGLESIVSSLFHSQKNKYLEENDFFAAINVTINKETSSVFSAPTIKRKIIPQPTIPKHKEFASEPTLSKETYDDILKVIYDAGKNMEKKPALYQGKDEEGLRDQFIFILETRYDGTTATGETFNRGGKTDIILKYANDASNLFVAECKFWHGSAEFLKAISQLFDRYLTWRDSKVALILFVTNKDFSNVLQTIKTDVKNHPYFVKESGNRGESSFSYQFHLPQDSEKIVYFEILVFHYDK
jgi:hypothetical protein